MKRALISILSATLLLLFLPAPYAISKIITCYKGSSVKKITSSNPVCPKGFSIKPTNAASKTASQSKIQIPNNQSPNNPNPPTQSSQADTLTSIQLAFSPVDVAHIMSISKFRSCAGHDFSPGMNGKGDSRTERARSMKHYLRTDLLVFPAHSLQVFSPIDGTILEIQDETFPLGKQIHIAASNGWEFWFFHVDPSISVGTKVKAGAVVGTIPPANAKELLWHEGPDGNKPYEFDVAIKTASGDFVSMLSYMTPAVLKLWEADGFTQARSILSKSERDAAPCALSSDGFNFANKTNNVEDPNDWVLRN